MLPRLTYFSPVFQGLLLAGVFSASLFFQGIDSPLVAPVVLGAFVFSLFSTVLPGLQRGWRLPATLVCIFVFLFWAYVSLSPLWSINPFVSTVFLFIIGIMPFLFFSLVLAPDPRGLVILSLRAVGVVLVVLALWALVQFFFLSDTYGMRIHHPLLSPNNLGVIFCMAVVMTLGFFMQAPDLRKCAAWFVLLGLFYMALLVTQSRGALLAGAISSIVLLVISFKDSAHWRYKAPAVAALAVFAFAAIDYSMGSRIAQSFARFENFNSDLGLFGRLELWGATLRMALDHFWTGTGLATFYSHYPSYRVPRETSDGYFAHMDPLQLWAEAGIAAPILFYAVLIAVLLQTIKALRALAPGAPGRVEIAASFCTLLGLALHTHVDFHLYVLPILVLTGVVMGYWYVFSEQALALPRVEYSGLIFRRAVFIGSVIVFLVGSVWISRAAAGVWFIKQASKAGSEGQIENAMSLLEQSDFWAPDSYSSVPETWGRARTLQLEQAQDISANEKEKIYAEGLEFFAQANVRNPLSPYALNAEALLHMIAYKAGIAIDGQDRAIDTLKKSLQVNPMFIPTRQALADIYIGRGQKKEALQVLEEGLPWPKPREVVTVVYLMKTANLRRELNGDEEGYSALFKEARRFVESINSRKK